MERDSGSGSEERKGKEYFKGILARVRERLQGRYW